MTDKELEQEPLERSSFNTKITERSLDDETFEENSRYSKILLPIISVCIIFFLFWDIRRQQKETNNMMKAFLDRNIGDLDSNIVFTSENSLESKKSTIEKAQRQNRIAILFRMHDPTPSMIQRFMNYTRQAKSRADFWIQFDFHSGDEKKKLFFTLETECAKSGCRIFYNTEKGMRAFYPNMKWEQAHWNRPFPPHTLSKGFHTEAINLWFQSYHIYEFVWVFESDVGFSGDFNNFLDIFAHRKIKPFMQRRDDGYCDSGYYKGWDKEGIDSIEGCKEICLRDTKCRFAAFKNGSSCSRYAGPTCTLTEDSSHVTFEKIDGNSVDFYAKFGIMMERWFHKTFATPAFLKATQAQVNVTKQQPRWLMAEHVIGISKRLLDRAHEISLNGGTSWSEAFLPSVCMTTEGFVCIKLQEFEPTGESELFGSKYIFNGRVEKQEWEAIMQDPNRQNKLWHALKF